MYNMLHGYEPSAGIVLGILQSHPHDIPRFRDAYLTYKDADEARINDRQPMMVILTRTGGNNREDYEEGNAMLRGLIGFIDDVDDEFDTTFALFRYDVPEELRDGALKFLSEFGRPLTLRQKTEQAIGPDQTKRQREAGERLAQQIKAAMESDDNQIIEV